MEQPSSKIVIYCQTLTNTSMMVDPVYIPNPDVMSTFQKQLRDLLVSVIQENKNSLSHSSHHLTAKEQDTNLFFQNQYLPILPVYPKETFSNSNLYFYNHHHHPHHPTHHSHIIPTGKSGALLLEQISSLQQDALTIYFGFSLIYGLLAPEWIIETIHAEVIKRSRQPEDSINYKDWKYAVEISQAILQQHGVSIITQRLPYSAQLESLTLYYYYTLIKGPLDDEAVKLAKKNAFALHYEDRLVPYASSETTITSDTNNYITVDKKMAAADSGVDGDDDHVKKDIKNDNDSNSNNDHNNSEERNSNNNINDKDEEDKNNLSLKRNSNGGISSEDTQSINSATNSITSQSTLSSSLSLLIEPKEAPKHTTNEPEVKKMSWATVAEKNKSAPVKNLVVNKLSDHVANKNEKASSDGDDIKRTLLCLYYRKGGCFHRDTCTFAHDDTSRVPVCREWKKGPNACKNGEDCQYLHCEKPKTNDHKSGSNNSDNSNTKFDLSLRKTRLCLHYKAKICPRSEKECHFAHEQVDKVPICETWDGNDCCNGDECTLLHPKNIRKLQEEIVPVVKKPKKIYKRVDVTDQDAFPVLGDKRPRTCSVVSDMDGNDGPGSSYATAAASKRQPVIRELPTIDHMEIQHEDDKISCSYSFYSHEDDLSNNGSNVKTKRCEFYRKGICSYDEETCHYAHEDLSRVRPCFAYMNTKKCDDEWCPYIHERSKNDNNMIYSMSPSTRKTMLCLDYLENKCPHKNEQDCDYAHADTQKVPVCRYWRSNGLCVKDKMCPYLHEEPANQKIDDYSLAMALDKKGYPVLDERIEELLVKSVIRSDYNYATVARREPPPTTTITSCPPSKKEDCHPNPSLLCVDEIGRAPKGGVIYKQRDSSASNEYDEDEDDEYSYRGEFISDAKELRHTKKCRLWWDENETCHRHDCWFAHDNTDKVLPCYFWTHGYCFNGDACLYMHEDRDSAVEQVANEQQEFNDEDDDNVSMASYEDESNIFTAETKRTRKCMHFWFGEGCTRESDKCRYAHEDLRYVSTCYYWQNNKKCPSESTCAYKHDEKPREKVWDDKARKDIYVKSPPTQFLHQTTSSQLAMWRKKLLTPPSPETLPRITSGNERNERRYTSLRSHAIKWGKKMNEETERASKAKQEGRLEDAESHEKRAYEYSGRMRRENAKASQAIFNECNNPKNRNRFIDLHGQHIAEAKQHIKRWFDDFQTQRDVVYIVTGAGRHSRNKNNNTTTKKGQLKEAIQDYLKRLYQYNETNVYGDDMGGVFAVLFCIHEYPSKHSRKCHKCEYVKQTE